MTDNSTEKEPNDKMTTFIREAKGWGKNFKQALRDYLHQHPLVDHPDRGDMSEEEYFKTNLFPKFKKIWIEIEKERTKNWVICSECQELLPPIAYYESSIMYQGATKTCIKCIQTGPRRFGYPKKRRK